MKHPKHINVNQRSAHKEKFKHEVEVLMKQKHQLAVYVSSYIQR